jgi:hypothetical protein
MVKPWPIEIDGLLFLKMVMLARPWIYSQLLVETSLPTPINARVYVNLPEGRWNSKPSKFWYFWWFIDVNNQLC